MKSFLNVSFALLLVIGLGSCRTNPPEKIEWNHLSASNKHLTDVIIEDIFTPPVASRIYAYANIAAYEVLATFDSLESLEGVLNDLSYSVKYKGDFDPSVASFTAFHAVAKKLVFNEERIQKYHDFHIDSLKAFVPNDIIENSVTVGKLFSDQIIAWLDRDGYNQRTGYPRYTPPAETGRWEPTPPDYASGIEPYWNTLRTFVIDSAEQFKPMSPTEFDSTSNSLFYKETLEVYEAVNNIGESEIEIAKFWDCNPNISYHRGHMMFFEQKLTPGGHWMSIASQVLEKEKADIYLSAKTFTLVGISLADAFISCWDEKYKSSLIRPETYINNYIDKDWKPILQTPAFPEYTSGHSVISSSAANTLTYLFGDNYQYTDSTEVEFGLPARSFNSFLDAADEAAISRLYGGIHYRPAIDNGVEQGRLVSNYIKNKLNY